MFPWSSVFGCKISTHSAREDGDSTFLPLTYAYIYFDPLRPRGRRLNICRCLLCYDDFNPLRPRGRRPIKCYSKIDVITISTHSAREDGDSLLVAHRLYFEVFQPTPPARTETFPLKAPPTANKISTHSAREDGDFFTVNSSTLDGEFQPTPPARTETAILHKKTNNSSSHFHNQITSYSLKSPPTCPAHIQNRSHCAVFPVRIPP